MLAVADFDRDFQADLAVTNAGADTVSILLNQDCGTRSATDGDVTAAPTRASDVDDQRRLGSAR